MSRHRQTMPESAAMGSLQKRLSRFLGLSLLLVFFVQWFVAVMALDKSADLYVVSRLRHDVESLSRALRFSGEGLPVLDAQKVNPTFERPFSGHYYRLHAQGIDLYSRSLWQTDLPLPALNPGQSQVARWTGPQQQKLLVYSESQQKGPYILQITVAEDLSFLKAPMFYVSVFYGVLSFVLFLLMLWLQSRVLQRSLQPLRQVQTELTELSQNKRQQISERVPVEIQPLIQAFNHLLRLLDQRLTRSRNALANLSHALKKPLTLMHQSLRSLENQPVLPPETRDALSAQLQRIQELIEHELRRGQLAGLAPNAQQIQLGEEIPFLLKLMQQSYAHKNLEVLCQIPPGHVFKGDRQDMLELLGNLLDNAFKWAQHRVRVESRATAGLVLEIADDGPGCPPELRSYLLERGSRLDQSKPGHGFGLSIALEIVSSYGGQLSLDQDPDWGGLLVRVTLPAEAHQPVV
ncbi:MAG: ATP-binding protein [Candidatus Sericytochromatia bacterium]|nr:ATP-binding protein [Candidatus Sericytochromatia bacterium]